MNKKVIIAIVVSILLIGGGVLIWRMTSARPKINANDYDPARVITVGDDKSRNQVPADSAHLADQTYGSLDSPLTLVEYGDMACTACAKLQPIMDEIRTEYADRVLFVFRLSPFTNIPGHENTRAAAVAATVAGYQGKFWEYVTLLFKNQSAWAYMSPRDRLPEFVRYAETTGLDTTRFQADFEDPKLANQHIEFTYQLGRMQDIQGTPVVFLNGAEVPNQTLFDKAAFRAFLDNALADTTANNQN